VLFPIMAQVQDQRHRLANAYERGLAIVALLSLPISAFLWVVAPEFIPVILGPKWTEVVLPFRLFTISLMFRMASKISDACIKAAGVVYSWALLQFAYAGLVVAGAILGQRWGVGGVAVCVSVAMGLDWLNMAHLSRKVTGLSWRQFAAAHAPAICLSVVIAAAAALAASAGHSAHLGNIPVLVAAGTAAVLAGVGASYVLPGIFLGVHGRWAIKQAEGLLRRGLRRPGSQAQLGSVER
jgi:O-antigen/teichoic acid export membrane protein